MIEDKSKLMSFAMKSGIFLGAFWVMKYLFVVVSSQNSVLQFLVPVFSALTPVILLQYLIKYRIVVLDNVMGFWHGVQFTIMFFFFASLFESVAVFIHITWIDSQFVGAMYAEMVEVLKGLNLNDSIVSNFESQPIPGALGYIINHVILSNIFIGILLSLIIVPISKRINPKNFTTKQSDRNE